jgi:hypothetical protein
MKAVVERPAVQTRPCACPGCPERLGPSFRSDAKYHSAACRAKAARDARKASSTLRRRKRTQPPQNARSLRATDKRTRPTTAAYNAPGGKSEPYSVPRMSADEAERRRPDWHRWVYGAAKNPIHETRPRPRS